MKIFLFTLLLTFSAFGQFTNLGCLRIEAADTVLYPANDSHDDYSGSFWTIFRYKQVSFTSSRYIMSHYSALPRMLIFQQNPATPGNVQYAVTEAGPDDPVEAWGATAGNGAWHLLTLVGDRSKDPDSIQIFLDETPISAGKNLGVGANPSNDLYVGGRFGGGADMYIDEIVFGKGGILTQAEITYLAAQPRDMSTDNGDFVSSSEVKFWARYEDIGGTEDVDQIGSLVGAFHGTPEIVSLSGESIEVTIPEVSSVSYKILPRQTSLGGLTK